MVHSFYLTSGIIWQHLPNLPWKLAQPCCRRCAGRGRRRPRASSRAWRAVLGIVLDGTFYCSKAFGRHMLERRSGRILNVLATYAWTGMPGVVHSASAKAGARAAPYGAGDDDACALSGPATSLAATGNQLREMNWEPTQKAPGAPADPAGEGRRRSRLAARTLVERFGIEPFSDFSAK